MTRVTRIRAKRHASALLTECLLAEGPAFDWLDPQARREAQAILQSWRGEREVPVEQLW
jgi:hypothetical protein